MNTTKTTKRENLTALETLLTAAETANLGDFNYAALRDYVTNEVELLNKKAEAAKARAAKAKEEGDALRDEIFGLLNADEFITIPGIIKTIGREDVTPQKVTARLTQLVKLNKVEKSEVSIEADGKTRKIQGYRVIAG